eukprot:gene29262-12505_t
MVLDPILASFSALVPNGLFLQLIASNFDSPVDARDGGGGGGAAAKLDFKVRSRLDALVAQGVVTAADLDHKVIRRISEFHPDTAVDALDQFATHDMTAIRNKPAYMSSVLGRHHRQAGAWLDDALRDGALKGGDLDHRCYEALGTLPPVVAIRLMEKYVNKDKSDANQEAAAIERGERPPPPPRGLYPPEPFGHGRGPPPDSFGHGPPGPFMGPPPEGLGGPGPMIPNFSEKILFGGEQHALGVRVDEFHELSVFSPYVHPAPALKLQQLWDSGVRLVSLMDDRAPREAGRGIEHLNPAVKDAVMALINDRPTEIKTSDLDGGLIDALNRLSDADAVECIADLATNDLKIVRNLPAFIMGICKRKRQRR